MLDFYRKTLLVFLSLLALSTAIAVFCITRAFVHIPLLPNSQSELNWQAMAETDADEGGQSTSVINDARFSLDAEFYLADIVEYPSASVSMQMLNAMGEPQATDLSRFNQISFNVKCSVPNVLVFIAFTHDEQITIPGENITYRAPLAFFSCDNDWSEVTLDLTRLEVPQWWLQKFQLKLSMDDYSLGSVSKLLFGTSYQSPRNQATRVQLSQIELHGSDVLYLYLLAACLTVIWCWFIWWAFNQHTQALTRDLKDKILRERPLVAYRQLSMQPQRNKDHEAILRYLATSYANSELNLDTAVTATGVNRTKINEVLKAELGLTFTGYLNKLRLTEAARLLAEQDNANVAEIAYSVGYKNVTYFNKLFKEEYRCTPKAFKQLYDKTDT